MTRNRIESHAQECVCFKAGYGLLVFFTHKNAQLTGKYYICEKSHIKQSDLRWKQFPVILKTNLYIVFFQKILS
jgi:hypothetical protein